MFPARLDYDVVMTTPAIRIRGMPYVPGSTQGRLQLGMQGDPAGRIVLLEQPLPGPFEPRPAGFVMVDAAPFSHDLIPLLGSGIPCILVSRGQAGALQEGMQLQLDGATGLLTTDLSAQSSVQVTSGSAAAVTADGKAVSLRVSARDRQAVLAARASGAGAIGLLRSEFLEPESGQAPDAAFYRAAFRRLCETAAGMPVTIRLIDVASSKRPSWLPPRAAADTLGRQGVRLYAEEPVQGIYRAQLQAIAGLAAHFELRILLPYVADLAELQHWSEDSRRRLGRPVAIGAMAETPAAALQLRDWLELVEFVAVGCNDLMQCLFGADRDRPELRRYLDPYAPALYRFLRQVANGVHERLEAVQLCGVLPQLPGILPVLIGLGYRAFSVEAAMLPYLRDTLATTRTTEAAALAEHICRCRDSAAVRRILADRAALTRQA